MFKFFGQRLKDLRTEKGLYQSDLSEDLGIAQNTISNWESGLREPSLEVVCRIAEYFKVTTDYLLGMTSIKNYDPKPIIENAKNIEDLDNIEQALESALKQIGKLKRRLGG